MNNTTTLSDRVSYRRIAHAAHYAYVTHAERGGPLGHDIEEWDIVSDLMPTFTQKTALGIPADAEFHVGYFDAKRNHHWTFTKRAPFSESAVCSYCRLRR